MANVLLKPAVCPQLSPTPKSKKNKALSSEVCKKALGVRVNVWLINVLLNHDL